MTKESFVLKMDRNNQKYLTTGIAETGKQAVVDDSNNRMYGPGVQMFELYMDKLSVKNNRLFQYPVKNFNPDSRVWYRNESIGKNTLANMMQKISKNAGLSTDYHCHSVASCSLTRLFCQGISPQRGVIGVVRRPASSTSVQYTHMAVMSTDLKEDTPSVVIDLPSVNPAVNTLQATGPVNCLQSTGHVNYLQATGPGPSSIQLVSAVTKYILKWILQAFFLVWLLTLEKSNFKIREAKNLLCPALGADYLTPGGA